MPSRQAVFSLGTSCLAALHCTQDLAQFVGALLKPKALIELAVFFACLGAAWARMRLWRGQRREPASIWFGARIVDGALFPLLALLLELAARRALTAGWFEQMPIAVFKLAVPILLSLAVIRPTVRLLHQSLPPSALVRVRLAERSVSWLT